jgi:transcriptional regulator with XRE-family HTH domain
MTNKEKFLALVSKEKDGTLTTNRERIKNREMLRASQEIALNVLLKLDELGWTQKDLAKKMKVSPQQITKIVSGKENLTIETQIKLQNILDIPILASYYEKKVLTIEKRIEKIAVQSQEMNNDYKSTKTFVIENYNYSQESFQPLAV